MPRIDDPEVARLLAATRRLTGQAFRLSTAIDETVTELEAFVSDVRASRTADESQERRRAD